MKQTIEVQRPGKSPSRVVIGDVINSLENYLPEGKRVVVIADEHVFHAYRPIIGAYYYCLIGLGETNKTLATPRSFTANCWRSGPTAVRSSSVSAAES